MDHLSVKNGVLGGVVTIIAYLILWFISPRVFLDYSWIGFAIIIFFMYRAGKEARDLSGGFIEFGEIFKYLFITFAVITLITTIFQYILMNFIDTGLIEMQKEMAIEAIEKIANALDNEEMTDKMMEGIEEQSFDLTILKSIQGWVFGMILGGIIAAVQAAIMKKKDPNFSEFA